MYLVTSLNTLLFISPSLPDKMSLPNTSVLLQWANTHIHGYGIRVNDLTTSWSDGLALCALIHRFHPELMSVFPSTLFPLVVHLNNALCISLSNNVRARLVGVPILSCYIPPSPSHPLTLSPSLPPSLPLSLTPSFRPPSPPVPSSPSSHRLIQSSTTDEHSQLPRRVSEYLLSSGRRRWKLLIK